MPYTPGEQPRGRKFIKLNTNENPYPPSAMVTEAIRQEAGSPLRLYPDPECTELRETIASYHGLTPDRIFVGNGSDEVLADALLRLFFNPAEGNRVPRVTLHTAFTPSTPSSSVWDYLGRFPCSENFGVPVEQFLGNNGGVVIVLPRITSFSSS